MQNADSTPLCVDLDGTLIATDLFGETFCALVARKPWFLFVIPFWFIKGRAFVKAELAKRVSLDVKTLPYVNQVVEYVRQQFQQGRQTVLVTASDRTLAESIKGYLGIFTEVIASDGRTNVRGSTKSSILSDRFGVKGYDYIGNSRVDFPVWKTARKALVVSSSAGFIERTKAAFPVEKTFITHAFTFKEFLTLIRAHQWVKNLLVFVAPLMAHKLFTGEMLVWCSGIAAFASLSLLASSVYILNDLSDVQSDRTHPKKRLRACASGTVPIAFAFILVPTLFLIGFGLALTLGSGFAIAVLIYYALTTTYTFCLKRVVLLDAITLAALYTVRIIAGGQATDTYVSVWLLVFSMFVFLSLAAAKRFIELQGLLERGVAAVPGRGYRAEDLNPIGIIGITAGIMSVLVLALYATSTEVIKLYSTPDILLLICPLIFYWICRLWLLAYRGELDEDPTIFAIKDRVSFIVGAVSLVIMLFAR
jgi:4-hydroxybenzoate polyprenyltransferase